MPIIEKFKAENYKSLPEKAEAVLLLDRYRGYIMAAVEMQLISKEDFQKEIAWVEDQARILMVTKND